MWSEGLNREAGREQFRLLRRQRQLDCKFYQVTTRRGRRLAVFRRW